MAVAKYGKYLIKKPVREVNVDVAGGVKGREYPTMTYMSRDLVPECDLYLEFGWIWDMPDPNPHIFEHAHDHDEVVLHIGSDPGNPEELGAEIEFMVDGEPLTIDKTSAIFVPKGVKHGPLTWKRVDKPHLEIAIVLGGGTLQESAPGGYSGKGE